MNEKREGSTAQLVEFSFWYFIFYLLFGVLTKYFTDTRPDYPHLSQMAFLYYSTIGGLAICLGVVVARRWWRRLQPKSYFSLGARRLPREYLWIVPSGICTAIIIPTTTLMYTLPITIMLAMTLMRASIIVIGRAVDAIQRRQGILKEPILWEENVAVVFAVSTVVVIITTQPQGQFDFLHSAFALTVMALYIGSYAIRIYIMNHYKNTQGKPDNKAFFGIEQLVAAATVITITTSLITATKLLNWQEPQLVQIDQASNSLDLPAILAGVPFGLAAFFSVFLFMFKGRNGTFSTLVNRLASLIAGTTATLMYHYIFKGKFPAAHEWISLSLVLIAVGFLVKAELRRKNLTTTAQMR